MLDQIQAMEKEKALLHQETIAMDDQSKKLEVEITCLTGILSEMRLKRSVATTPQKNIGTSPATEGRQEIEDLMTDDETPPARNRELLDQEDSPSPIISNRKEMPKDTSRPSQVGDSIEIPSRNLNNIFDESFSRKYGFEPKPRAAETVTTATDHSSSTNQRNEIGEGVNILQDKSSEDIFANKVERPRKVSPTKIQVWVR